MREILFKAKRLDNGEWVEGTPLFNPDMSKGKIFSFAEYLGNDEISFYHYAVDADTICQYTGLTDSNGVMIFEGDILEYKDNYTSTTSCTVEFLRSAFMAVWPNDWDNEILDKGFSKYAKVIGNIHDKEE